MQRTPGKKIMQLNELQCCIVEIPHGGGAGYYPWDRVCLFTQLGMRRHNTLNICHSQSRLTFQILPGLGRFAQRGLRSLQIGKIERSY